MAVSESGLGTPVLDLPFDGTLSDTSGLGTFTSSASFIAPPGRLGGAYGLNSSRSFSIPYSPALKTDGPFSVELWVKYSKLGKASCCADYPLVNRIDSFYSRSWSLHLTWGQDAAFYIYTPSGEVLASKYNDPILVDRWYHLAGVYDGRYAILYRDGIELARTPVLDNYTSIDYAINVGKSNYYCCHSYNAQIDELRLYNYALSPSQVQAHASLEYETSAPITPAACVESWSCGAWGPCQDGSQLRACSDSNACGTVATIPPLSQACAALPVNTTQNTTIPLSSNSTQNITTSPHESNLTPNANPPANRTNTSAVRPSQDNPSPPSDISPNESSPSACVPSWQCSGWGPCVDAHQSRTCVDPNACGTSLSKPAESQGCACVEDWECSAWSPCVDKLSTRSCLDKNLCGTALSRPAESQTCQCTLTRAYWSQEQADTGNTVYMTVEGQGCDGLVATFEIRERANILYAILGGQSIDSRQAFFVNGTAKLDWTAAWRDSNPLPYLKGNPKYSFHVKVNPEMDSANLLTVSDTPAAPIQAVAQGTMTISASSPGDWPQFQHDAQHTGHTNLSVAPDYNATWVWIDKSHIVRNFKSAPGKNVTDGFGPGFTFTTIFGEQMQPIVASGIAYFGSMNGVMYAVNASTGANLWDFTTEGPILGSAAYSNGAVVFGSMDGKVYGLVASTGSKIWEYQTGAGINAPPVVDNGVAYVGSRDGYLYAIDISSGALRWSYAARVEPADSASPFNKAPIVAPAAISEDGSTVCFGAENTFFYALNTANGQERWTPKKLIGQGFLYGWPVVKGNLVIVRTMSALPGAEEASTGMEAVLDGISANPGWPEEKAATLGWLASNPEQKTMYVFDVNTGAEPYTVAMGRVTGNLYTAHPPIIDSQDRILTYWRSKDSTLFVDQGSFGSKYCPDISAMDPATGDRVKLANPSASKQGCPELDNGFMLSVGGDYLYEHNDFRGAHAINLVTGAHTYFSAAIACRDGSNWRYDSNEIVYYGNDQADCSAMLNPLPSQVYANAIGFTGIAIASSGGASRLFINEGDVNGIVSLVHK